ncbi:MAG: methyltransferase [Paracoccaceae bacterium]|nr:methyltransferase [Paracoccaceae bacterium]
METTEMDQSRRRKSPRLNLEAIFRLTELADYIIPFTIRAVAELGVADTLSDGPRHVSEIAKQVEGDADAIYRALRALACKDIFTETEPGVFKLTPMAEFLRSDHPLSLRDAYRPIVADIEAWIHITQAVETGKPAFEMAHGESYWTHLERDAGERAKFDLAQQAHTRLELLAFQRAIDWNRFETIVDVGGGNGAFLAGLLETAHGSRGIVADQQPALEQGKAQLGEQAVAGRLKFVPTDFMQAVPKGGSAYLLKRILYGWDEHDAALLLSNIRAAMSGDARLLLIEPVDDDTHTSEISCRLDLSMLVMKGCGARRFEALDALFDGAGLQRVAVHPTPLYPIIEARLASS